MVTPQGHFFFIKTISKRLCTLEKYGVSKKWVIIMDRRPDSDADSTPEEKCDTLLLFFTNCVVVIAEYLNSNHL